MLRHFHETGWRETTQPLPDEIVQEAIKMLQ